MKFYGCTDVGKRRVNNQDCFIISEYKNGWTLCAVFDGMGGTNGGTEASSIASWIFDNDVRTAVEKAVSGGERLNRAFAEETLHNAAREANRVVYEKSMENIQLTGMGTTLVAALVSPDEVYVINIGDSRLYAERMGALVQITKDHSYVQYLVDEGKITAQEAYAHPQKNLITRSVGTDEATEGDTYRISGIPSYLLLCSDGLTNFVSEDEIARLLGNTGMSGEEILKALIKAANDGGGGDNITAVIALDR